MPLNVWDWSKTPSDNADADSGINWAENMAAGAVDDSARAMMAALANLAADQGGGQTTAGTTTAYTLTTNSGLASLADGVRVHAVANATNTGASTLAVDGLAAKSIRRVTAAADVAVGAGDLVINGHYILEYDASANSAAGAWIVLNPEPWAGSVVQVLETTYTTNANITASIPLDDTAPQNTEGTQILSQAITPRSASNKILCLVSLWGTSATTSVAVTAAIFRSGTASAINVATGTIDTGFLTLTLSKLDSPATAVAVTYSVRLGVSGTVRLNGNTVGRFFGGASACTLTLMEVRG